MKLDFQPPRRTLRLLQGMAAAGALALAAGALVTPQRTWANLLVASFLLIGLGLAGLLFIALEYVTHAGWSVAFRRVPEAMACALPCGAAGLALVLIAGAGIYPWTHEPLHGFKGWWLSTPFFLGRAALYVLLWVLLGRSIIRTSRRQDADGEVAHTHRNIRTSIVFILVFSVSFWLASYDWIMSLEPHWASTIFGIYNFAGLFASGLAALIILVSWLGRSGPLRGFVTAEHLHDLGKLYFAFSTFWMYIWFSQYMLIWYANITEEAVYFVRRQQGAWGTLMVLNICLNWVIPFLALLGKRAKRDPRILVKVAAVGLAGRWLDLYLMVNPAVAPGPPRFGPIEVALAAAAAGIFVLAFLRGLRGAAPVPVEDPRLAESLAYHT
ncbi:MAG: hypothetical protein IT158_21740 [Bryobacterales bacterium]|nr:hypothetical protein [Bryobacterales bacterium]